MTPRKHPPLWLLVLVTFSGTLAMHMFVPALTTVARELGTSPAAMQMTISVYVMGLAFGQLAYGPLSDKVGRRPALLAGLFLYSAAGVVCMLAPNAQVLLVARFFQALGGCAGLLLGRAIVRDTAGAEDTIRRLALLSLMAMVGPGLAPVLGSLVVATLGWRWIFALFVLLGVAGLVLSWHLLPETRRIAAPAEARTRLIDDYKALLRSPAFIGCAVGGGCATTALYAFIAAAPFLFVEQLHEPVGAVGIYLCVLVVGLSVGNIAAGRLVGRLSLNTLMVGANAVSGLCAAALLLQMTVFEPRTGFVVATMFCYCVGGGICSPAVSTKAMSVNPKVTGSAAGLFGFAQMMIGAACTSLAGIGTHHGLAAAAVLAGAGVVSQIAFRFAVKGGVRADG